MHWLASSDYKCPPIPRGRMYASPDTAVPFAAALVFFCVLERVMSALASLFLTSERGAKQAASAQFLISVVDGVTTFVGGVGYSLAGVFLAALRLALWVAVLLMIGSVVYVVYEDFPWVWTDLARAYNVFLGQT